MLDSNEISEWRAYEAVAGPLDSSWALEVLGQLHELLQQHLIVTVDANSKNPTKQKVRNVPRPWITDEDMVSGDNRSTQEKNKMALVAWDAIAARGQEDPEESGYGATYM